MLLLFQLISFKLYLFVNDLYILNKIVIIFLYSSIWKLTPGKLNKSMRNRFDNKLKTCENVYDRSSV